MTYQFKKFREKPIEAVRYDGSLEAAVWLAGHSNEFDVVSSQHTLYTLFLRGFEVRPGQFIRKGVAGYAICEPDFVHTHEPTSDIIKGD